MSKRRWDAMNVQEYTDSQGNNKSHWTKIGAAFENRDGSIGVTLDCLPLNGKVILQIPLSKEEKDAKFGNRGDAGGGGQRGRQPGNAARYQGRREPERAFGPANTQSGNQPSPPDDDDELPF